MGSSTPQPFKISVEDGLLNFVKERVKTARIPPGVNLPPQEKWAHGMPPDEMSRLRSYWEKSYDWRKVEARINHKLRMFTLPIESKGETITMHFVHHRSPHPNAIPLLFQHGWPGNFLEVEHVIDLLTDPKDPRQQAYHVVAPSLPGFAFSSQPQNPEFRLRDIATVNNKLMLALGYTKYMAQGGDWGSIIGRIQGRMYPENCIALHINMIFAAPPSIWRYPFHFIFVILWMIFQTKFVKTGMINRMMWFRNNESGYQEIQSTKPQTLAYGLVDSPMGMLAWIREKIQFLTDDGYIWDDEDVITWTMLYIINGTSGHSAIYKNLKPIGGELPWLDLQTLPNSVDFGVSVFPRDVFYVPRWWAAVTVSKNITYWREHDKGGHFAAYEVPVMFVEDIREFTKSLRGEYREALRGEGQGKGNSKSKKDL